MTPAPRSRASPPITPAGMNHAGEPTVSGRDSPLAWLNGARVTGGGGVEPWVEEEVLRLVALVGDRHGYGHRSAGGQLGRRAVRNP